MSALDLLVRVTMVGLPDAASAREALARLLAERLPAEVPPVDSWGVAGLGEEPDPHRLLQRACAALRALRGDLATPDPDEDTASMRRAARVLDAVASVYPAMVPGWGAR